MFLRFSNEKWFLIHFLCVPILEGVCVKVCASPIIESDSVIYSGPNRVKMENIGPKYRWLGQHSMDWTKKEMD